MALNPNFPNATKALVEWEAAQPALDRQLHDTKTNEQFYKWEADSKAVDDKLRLAFFEDTKTYNNKDNCMRIPAEDIRRLILEGSWQ